jgi:hypothetical protein
MSTRADQAAAIWPHLPTQRAEPRSYQVRTSDLARAMYPNHMPNPEPRPPAPAPTTERYRVPLAAAADANPQLEWRLRMSGLHRVR